MASRPRSLRTAFLMAAAAVGLAPGAKAGTLAWYADPDSGIPGGSGTWDLLGLNWQESDLGGLPTTWVDDGTGDARFEGDPGDITLDGNLSAASLTFVVDGYRILGGAGPFGLTLGSGGITADGNAEITSGLALSAAQSWTVLEGKTLTVAGPVSGAFALTKAGAGTLTLSAANTFSGATTLTAGTLVLGHASALAGSTLDLSSGTGTLGFATVGTYQLGGLSGSRNLALGDSTIAVGANNASTTYSGILSGNGGLTKQGTGTLTLSGANTFAGKLAITGGTLSVSAESALGATPASALADALALDGGTLALTTGNLTLSANRGITLGAAGGTIDTSSIADANNNSVTVAGAISGTGNLTVKAHGDVTGSGGGSNTAVRLSGANTFTGTVTIADGLVTVDSSLGAAANALRFANGGGLVQTSATAATVARDIEVLATGGTIRQYGSTTLTLAGALTGSGTLSRTDAGTLNLTGDLSGFTGTFANLAGTTVLDTARSAAFAGITLGGGSLLVRHNHAALGAATVDVTGNATFGTQTGSSTLVVDNDFAVASGATLTVAGSPAPLVLRGAVTGAGNLTLSGNVTLLGEGTGAGTLRLANGAFAFIGAGYDGTFTDAWITVSSGRGFTYVTGGSLRVTGQVRDARDAYFNYVQHGGVATFGSIITNQTEAGNQGGASGISVAYLTGGTLAVGEINAQPGTGNTWDGRGLNLNLAGGTLRATGNVTWSPYLIASHLAPSTLDVSGFNVTVTRNFTGTGLVNLSSATGKLILSNLSSVTAGFSGSGALEKTGGSTMALSGDFSGYTGTLTLSAGTTQLGADLDRGFAGVISGSGNLQKVGAGVLTLSGANTWSGNLAINAGAVSIEDLASLPGWDSNGRWSVASGAALAVGNSIAAPDIAALRATTNFAAGSYLGFDTSAGDRTYAGNLGGAVGVAKFGDNTLTLSGATTFTGNLMVARGTLDLGGGARSLSGNLVLAGGTLANGSLAVAAIDGRAGLVTANLGGSGALTKTTNGVLTLSGSNTYAGVTTVSGGVLAIADKAALPGWNLNRAWFVASGAGLTVGNAFADADVAAMLELGNFAAGSAFGFDTSAGDRTYSGSLGNASVGARGLAKSGANTLTVTGVNTFTGPVIVTGGTLSFGYVADGGPSNLGGYSSLSLSGGATLRFTGNVGSTARAMAAGQGGGVLQVDEGGNLSLLGFWSGSGGLTKTGAGTLTVGNNYAAASARFNVGTDSGGNFTMAEGVLNISPSQYFTLGDNSRDIAFLQTGGIVNINAVNGTYLGNGGAGGPNATYTATYTLSGGELYQAQDVFRVGQNGYSRGVLTIGGGSGSALANLASVQLAASSGNSEGTLNLLSGGVLVTSNLSRVQGAGTVNFDGGTLRARSNTSSLLTGLATLVHGGGAILDDGGFVVTISQSLLGAEGSGGGLTKRGAGILRLDGANTYAGLTAVENGTLALGSVAALPGWDSPGRLAVSEGAGLALGNNVTDAQLGQLVATGGFAAGAFVGFDTVNGDRTFAAVLADGSAGALGLVKVGANILSLSGANTFTGAAAVREGTLLSIRAEALASASALAVANGATLAVAVGGASGYTDAQLGALLGKSTFADGSTLGFDTSAATGPSVYSSSLTGGLGFTKLGAGQLTLSGSLTYGGPTNLLGGSLVLAGNVIDNTSALNLAGGSLDLGGGTSRVGAVSLATPAASGVTLANGTLVGSSFAFSNASGNAQVTAGLSSLTGGIAKTGAGTVTLAGGVGSVGGTLSVTGGTFAVSGAELSIGSVTLGSGATLSLGAGSLRTTVSQASLNSGTLLITGGNHSVIGFRTSDSSGAVTVINHSGGVLNVTGSVIANGTNNSFLFAHWGQNGANSTYLLSGGILNVLNTKALIGWDGAAVFNQSGGVANLRGLNFNSARNNAATYNLTGGRLNLGVSGIEGNNTNETFNAGAGTIGGYADWSTTQNLVLTDATTGVTFDSADSLSGLGRIFTLSGVLSGAGRLNVTGTGAVVLGAANTYTGLTTVRGGALRLANANALAGGIGATGGTAALSLDGGVIDLAAGDFSRALGTGVGQVAFAGSGGFAATGAARTVNLGGAAAQVTWGAGSFVPNGGQLILGHALANATVTFANPIDLGAANRTVRVDEGAAAVDGILSGAITGAGGLIKAGAGTLRLTGTNTYAGGTVVSAGTLAVASAASLPGWDQVGGFSIAAGAALAVDNSFADGDLATLLATGNFATGSLLGFDTTAGNREVTAALTGPVGLVKTGANTLTLSGDNDLTGGTLVSGGTLLIARGDDRLSVTGDLNVTGGTLDLGGNSQSTSGLVSLAGGSITNGNLAATGAITLASGTLSANLSGTAALTKSGVGTAVLSGANTYAGGTTVSGGILQLSSAGAAGTGAIVADGGNLSLLFDGSVGAGPEEVTFGNDLDVRSATVLTLGRLGAGAGGLNLTALNKTAVLGDLTLGAAPLEVVVNQGYGVSLGAATLTAPAEIRVTGATDSNVVPGATLRGVVTGTGGLTKSGNGTLVLANAGNTFSGHLTVAEGYVAAASDGALGAAANELRFAPGAGLRALGSFSLDRTLRFAPGASSLNLQVVSGETLEFTGSLADATNLTQLVKSDRGTLRLSAAASSSWSGSLNTTYDPTALTGGLLVNAGVVEITHAQALGAASNVVALNASTGAALHLSGGITLANSVAYLVNANYASGLYAGVRGLGGLASLDGANTVSGLVTFRQDMGIGAAAGATLNLTGGVQMASHILSVVGPGTVNISGGALLTPHSLHHLGSGTFNLTSAIGAFTGNGLRLFGGGGVVRLADAGAVGSNNKEIVVYSGDILWVDNAASNLANRLGGGGAQLSITDANFRLTASATSATWENFGALRSWWGSSQIQVDTTGQASTLRFTNLNANAVDGGSVLHLRAGGTGAAFGTAANTVLFTTTGPNLSNRIIPGLVLTDATGVNLGTHVGGSIRAFADYSSGALLAQSSPNLTATNARLATEVAYAGGVNLNALVLDGGASLSRAVGNPVLNVSTGNLLVTSGTATLGAGLIVQGTSGSWDNQLSVAEGAVLEVDGVLVNAYNTTIGLGGTVNFNARQYFNTAGNWLTLGRGRVELNAGDNTLYEGTSFAHGQQNLALGFGAVLDLNGSVQMVGAFRNPNNNAYENSGGEITSATSALFVSRNISNSTDYFGGRITGAVTYLQNVNNRDYTRTFYSDNTYTGSTVISGGVFQLYDGGRISGTSAIEVNSAYLNIRNDSMFDLSDRVNDAAPVTLRGGFIYFQGRPQGDSRETLGAVTLAGGISDFRVDAGGTAVNSAVLTLANLTSANDAAVNFRGWGLIGNAGRLLIADRETNPGLTNNLIGAWAVVNGGDFASYVPGLGVGALNQAGFAGYDGAVLPAASAPAANIKLAAAATQAAGDLALNSLVLGGNYSFANAADTLRLVSGGLLRISAAATFGASADSGRLTAGAAGATGTQALHIHANSAAVTMNSRVVDNGAAPVRLVVDVYNGGSVTLLSANNSYTGGTVVNGWSYNDGTLTVGATGRLPAGGLTLNHAKVTQVAGGVIDPANVVTLNNSSSLTLVGNNTLAGLVFNHRGGQGNSGVTSGGTLTLTGGITSTPGSTAVVGVISGTISWNGAAASVTVNPIAYDGRTITDRGFALLIDAVIANTGLLTVAGGGNLALRGANTFAGGVLVKSGTGVGLNNNAGFGTGAVTFEDDARLLAYSSSLTATNAWTALGDLDYDGINNFTLGGAATLRANGTTAVNVVMPQGLLVLTGALGGTNSTLEKTGLGVLRLGNAANSLAAVRLTEGTLQLNNAGALGSASLELAGGNLDSATANLALTTAGAQTWSGDFGFTGTQSLNLGAGAVTLTADRAVGVSANVLTVGGALSDGGAGFSLTKVGNGTLSLSGANTYGGDTVVAGGALRLASASALPAAGNLVLAGGVVDLAAGDFSRSLGTGAGQVSFGPTGGGFAATGAARSVNLGGAGAQLAWGQGGFLADGAELILSHSLSDNTVTLANPLALGASNRTVRVDNGTAAVDAVLAGALSGTGGLVKAGAGTLRLDAANTYTGATTLAAGTLAAGVADVAGVSGAFGNGGALTFTGGALQITDFLPADIAGRIQGSTAAIAIDTNGLGYNLTGNLGASNTGGFTKLGAGTLRLTGTNAYTGPTTVTGGTLVVGSDANLGVSSSSPVVLNGGTLLIAGAERFASGRPLNLTANSTINVNNVNGAAFAVTNAAGLTLTKEGIGELALNIGTGASTIRHLLINGGNISLGEGTLTINAGGAQSLYANASSTISGGTIILGSGSSDDNGTRNGTVLTINSRISGGNPFELWGSNAATGVTILGNAANDFSGVVSINVGILSVASINNAGTASHLGAGSSTNNMIDITGGSTLRYTGAGSTTNRYVRLTGTTAGGVIDHRGTGLLRFTTDFTASGAGSKTLTLTGWGTGSGEINANVADNSSTNRTGIIKEGTNTWIFSRNASMTYTGATDVRNGTLELNFGNLATPTNLVSASSALTLGGGTLSILGKNGATGNAQTFASLTLSGTAGSRLLANPNGNTAAAGVTVNLGAITATTAGSSLLLGKAAGTTGTVAFTTTTNKAATGIYTTRAVYTDGSAFNWLTTASTASAYSLGGLGTYATLAATGTDTSNSRVTASATLTGSVTTNTLKVDGPAAGQSLALGANTLTLTAGGLLSTGANAFSLTGGTLTSGNGHGAYELLVHQYSTGALTIGSVIANNGANATALTKAGTGVLTLSGANTYTGVTYLHAGTLSVTGSLASTTLTLAGGTLQAGSAGAFATGATVNVNGGVLDLNGFNRTLSNLGAGTLGGLITDNSATAGTTTLTVSGYTPSLLTRLADGANRKLALVVSNGNNGNNFLNNDNTFSGGLTLANGTGSGTRLSIANSPVNTGAAGAIVSSPFGRGTITIGQAAGDKVQFYLNSVNGQTFLNDIVYNSEQGTDRTGAFRVDIANFILAGTQTGNLAPVNLATYSGGSAFFTGKITGSQGLKLRLNSNEPNAALTVTLANAAGTNDYAGDTTIEGRHILVLGASNQLPDGTGKGSLSLASGATFDLNGLRETVNGLSGSGTIDGSINSGGDARLTVGSADASSAFSGAIRNTTGTLALEKIGSGTLTLTGANTHTGGTTVTGGTLRIGDGGTAGSLAGNVAVAGGATLAFNRSDATSYAGSVSGAGQLQQLGAGTLALAGANTHTGGTLVATGTLSIASDAALGAVAAVPTANQLILDNGTLAVTETLALAANRGIGLGGESAAGTGTLSVAAGRTLTVAGAIADRGTAAGSLVKAGAGTLVLAGANTHTGSTTVQAGRLEVSLDTQLGAVPAAATTGNLALAGGTLAVTNGFALSSNRGLTLSGANTLEVAAGQTLSYGGVIANGAGAGSLAKTGAGTLLVTGSHTFSGATTLAAGTLEVGGQADFGPSAVTVASGATLAGDGRFDTVTVAAGGRLAAGTSGLGTLGFATQLTFQGASTLSLGVDGNAVGSTFEVAGGLEILGGAGSLTFDFGNRLAELGEGTYNLLAYGGIETLDLGLFAVSEANRGARQTLTLVEGAGDILPFAVALQVENARAVWTGLEGPSWTAENNWIQDTDAAVTSFLASDAVVFDDTGSTGLVTLAQDVNPASIVFEGDTLAYQLGGPGGFRITTGRLTKTGDADLTLLAANTYAGGSSLAAGIVRLGDDAALGSGLVELRGGRLASVGAAARALANDLLLAGDVVLGSATDTGALAFSGQVDLGGGVRELTVDADTTFSGIVANGGLAKAGAGALTLAAANTFAGGVTLAEGSLRVGADTALGLGQLTLDGGRLSSDSAAARTLANPVAIGGDIALGDAARAGTLTLAGAVSLGGATRSLDLASDVVIAGAIANGSLIKAGDATLTLAGANTYAGGTTVEAGALRIGDGGLAGSLSGDIANAGEVVFNRAGRLEIDGILSGAGNFAHIGSGILALSGLNAQTGDFTVSGGTLEVASAANLGAGTLVLSGGTLSAAAGFDLGADHVLVLGPAAGAGRGTLAVAATQTLTLAGTLVQRDGAAATLVKDGAGTLVLTADSSLAGGVRIDAGTLRLGAGGETGMVLGPVANAGTLVFDRSDTLAFAGVISGAGSLVQAGSGTLALTAENTYTGATTVTAGTLLVSADTQLGEAPGSATPASLVLAGGTLATETDLQIASSRGIAVGATGGTLRVGAGATLTYGGAVANLAGAAGILIKSGDGTLSLTNPSTLTGGIQVLEGTLRLAGSGYNLFGNPSAPITIADGAVLTADNALNNAHNLGALTLAGGTLTSVNGPGGVANDGNFGNWILRGVTVTGTSASLISSTTLQVSSGAFDVADVAQGVDLLVTSRITGSSAVTKAGAGTMELAAANAQTGTTTVNAGTLLVTNTSALGTGALALGGGTLHLATDTAIGTRALTLAGTGGTILLDRATPGEAVTVSLGALTFGDTRTLAVAKGANVTSGIATLNFTGFPNFGPAGKVATIDAAADVLVNITGSLTGTQAFAQLVKFGAGTLALSGNNDWWDPAGSTGQVTVNAGTLELRSVNALGDGGTGANSIALRLAAGSAVRYASDAAQGNHADVTTTGTGATLTLDRATAGAGLAQQFDVLNLAAGTLVVRAGDNVTSGTSIANFNATTLSGNATLDVRNSSAGGAGRVNLAGIVSGAGFSLSKAGAGTLVLGGANTYTGGTSVDGGTVILTGGLSTTGAVMVNSGAFVMGNNDRFGGHNTTATPALTIGPAGVLRSGGYFTTLVNLTLAGGDVELTGGANANFGAFALKGTLTVSGTEASAITAVSGANNLVNLGPTDAAGSVTFDIADATGDAAADLRVAAVLQNNRNSGNNAWLANGLVKTGAGTLTLAADNTFSGETRAAAGVIRLESASALGASTLRLAAGETGSVAFAVAGDTTYVLGGLAGERALSLGANSLTVGSNGGSSDFSGDLAVGGALTKVGAGTLTLTGANTLGPVAVNAGLLGFGAGSLGSSTVTLNGGGLRWAAGNTEDISARLAFVAGVTATFDTNGNDVRLATALGGGTAANLAKAGAGTLVLGAALDHTGSLAVNGGSLEFAQGYLAASSGISLGGGTLRWAAGNTEDLSARISFVAGQTAGFDTNGQDITLASGLGNATTGGLRKAGDGTLTLTGANTFTGALAIEQGSLRLDGSATLAGGAYAGAIANAGQLQVATSANQTLSGVISGAGSLAKSGAGTLSLSGASTFSGGVEVTDGTLRLSSNAGAGTGTITLGGAGSGNVSLLINNNADPANAIVVSALGSGTVTIGTDGGGAGSNPTLYGGELTLNRATTLVGNSTDRTTYSGRITGNVGTLTIGGNARTTFGGTGNDYVGATVVNAGAILQVDTATGALPDATDLTVNGSLYLNSLVQESVASLAGSGRIQVHPVVTGAHALIVAGDSSTTFSGVIANGGGTLALAKQGTGTLTLTGANTHTGGTTVTGGTLAFAAGSLGSVGQVSVDGGTLRWEGANTSDLSARLVLGAAGATLDTGANDVTFAGALAAAGTLAKQGSGTLVLLADGALAGSASVAAGRLVLGSAGAVGNAAIDIAAGATLTLGYALATDTTLANAITGAGILEVATSGAGKLSLGAYEGDILLSDGDLDVAGFAGNIVYSGGAIANGLATFGGTFTVAAGATWSAASGLPANVILTNGATIDFLGAAGPVLSADIDYRGGTLANGDGFVGNLMVNGSGVNLAAGALGNGTVILTNGNAATVGAGLANTIRYQGGTLSDLAGFAGRLEIAPGATFRHNGPVGGTVAVGTGATLAGNGSYETIELASGATLAPGSSPGVITAGTLDLSGGSSLVFEFFSEQDFVLVDGQLRAGFDRLEVTTLNFGDASAQNRINLTLATLANWNDVLPGAPLEGSDLNHLPGELKSFSLITFQQTDRVLADGQDLSSLFNFDTSGYLATDGTSPASGFQVVAHDVGDGSWQLTFQVIPEPSTYGLMLGGLALAAAALRRRRKKVD